jgi:predicted DNA-binding transcriptional regulator AlpA
MNAPMKHRPFYCVKEVEHLTGRTRNTLYRWRKTGFMPDAVKFGPNSIGWYIDVLDAWLLSRPAQVVVPKKRGIPPRSGNAAAAMPA